MQFLLGYPKNCHRLLGLYGDIHVYDEKKVFTVDSANFAGLPEYVAQLRSQAIHTITILVGNILCQYRAWKQDKTFCLHGGIQFTDIATHWETIESVFFVHGIG